MGKIRVKTFGDEVTEEAEKLKKATKNAEKKARSESSGQAREEASEEPSEEEVKTESPETPREEVTTSEETVPQAKAKTKKTKFIKKKVRSNIYKTKLMEIEKNKVYSLAQGIELLRKVKIAKFDETVELHINTTEPGINGTVKLPHGTGKEIRIAIADDAVLAEVEKGKVNFDILIATPDMMPKLARVARILGPRGLMPNPKNGTISAEPQEAAKKFQGGQISFKTESKVPLMHLSVGKTSFEDKQLSENIKTVITAIKKDRIRKITLKSTMSPGIKIQA